MNNQLNIFRQTSGYSILKIIILSPVVLIIFLSTIEIIKIMKRADVEQKAITLELQAESAFLSLLADPSSVRDLLNKLNQNQVGVALFTKDKRIIGRINKTIYIDKFGSECTNNSSCLMQSNLALNCNNVGGIKQCSLRYSFVANRIGTYRAMPFSVVSIPYFDINGTSLSLCPKSDSFITGFNKYTGALNCVDLPKTTCPTGELLVGLTLSAGNLNPICKKLNELSCPPNYSIHAFNTGNFLDGNVAGDQCIFRTKKVVSSKRTLIGINSVSGKLCPKYYKAKPICILKKY